MDNNYYRAYRERNREKLREYYREYRRKNQEKLKEYSKIKNKEYYLTHKEEIYAKVRKWQKDNPDRVSQNNAKYRIKRKELIENGE